LTFPFSISPLRSGMFLTVVCAPLNHRPSDFGNFLNQ
jgi:hypothetical protein